MFQKAKRTRLLRHTTEISQEETTQMSTHTHLLLPLRFAVLTRIPFALFLSLSCLILQTNVQFDISVSLD